MKTNLLPIARESFKYLCCIAVIFVLAVIFDSNIFKFLSFLSFIFIVYFFRNPEREIVNYDKDSVVSVVDGKILNISELNDYEEYAYKVDIKTTYCDVSFLRTPMNSKIKDVFLYRGTRVGSSSKLFSSLNEFLCVTFENSDTNRVKVEHRLTKSFDDLHINVVKSQKLLQTQRYGFMLSGITSIYLPSNFRLNISVGNEVQSSKTLIGYFS